jgi:hypothetical protein
MRAANRRTLRGLLPVAGRHSDESDRTRRGDPVDPSHERDFVYALRQACGHREKRNPDGAPFGPLWNTRGIDLERSLSSVDAAWPLGVSARPAACPDYRRGAAAHRAGESCSAAGASNQPMQERATERARRRM